MTRTKHNESLKRILKTNSDSSKKATLTKQKSLINKFLGNNPGRTLHRVGVVIAGIWITSSFINTFWPTIDQIKSKRDQSYLN